MNADPKDGGVRTDWGKEIVAAFLSVAIASVTVWMLLSTYRTGSQPFLDKDTNAVTARKDAYERGNDSLLYGLSLLGTVLGYYFGRIPAEKSASAARKDASRARGELAAKAERLLKSETQLQRVSQGAERLVNSAGTLVKKTKQDAARHATLGEGQQEQTEELQNVDRDVRDLEGLLRRD